ncbi:hypothetical protein [Cellulomonas sp. KRMCY2]|uniref:hypothetical protein n=1 Tax=Cellulomonas sp. KRMCY2 TaxID=1304865 RepID=UPI00045EC688|nr:hypothetical protein [Cellulomonas sp. KRMCY2]
MGTDEDFARTLRMRLDAVAPRLDVDTTRVVPRARRRRAVVRGLGTFALAAVVAGGGWAAQARPWSSWAAAPPAALVGPVPTPSVTPTAEPDPTPSVAPVVQPTVLAGTYWYTLRQSSYAGDEHQEESWLSRDEPGLLVTDGDLTTATGVGPRDVIGRFRIDGEWIDMLRDPALLPVDPTALEDVLRASVEPDRRSGTDDDKVFGMARDLLLDGGLLPVGLRQAAWAVAAGVPGVTASDGADSTGRTGEVLEHTADGVVTTLVRDPETGLLLEESSDDLEGSSDDWSSTYLDQRLVEDVPVEPTLENSGCTSWATC